MKDIQRLLLETQKPKFTSGEHKNQLKSALVNSKRFKQKKSILPKVLIPLSAGSVLAAMVVAAVFYAPQEQESKTLETSTQEDFVTITESQNPMPTVDVVKSDEEDEEEIILGSIRKFGSLQELRDYLEKNQLRHELETDEAIATVSGSQGSFQEGLGGGGAVDFSTTNTQVEGVDEADVVKNDGRYIYAASDNRINIFEAYPANEMKKLSEIIIQRKEQNFGKEVELYLKGNNLIAVTSEFSKIFHEKSENPRCELIEECPQEYYEENTIVYIYDISDRAKPKLKDKITSSGYYADSRMIGDYVYVLTTQDLTHGILLPSVEKNGQEEVVKAEEIFYDKDYEDYRFQFTNVLAIDTRDGDVTQQVSLAGNSQEIYVSKENIYATHTSWDNNTPEDERDENKTKTIINKISVDQDKIEYTASGDVPGWIKDQFSMDEYNKNLRIATTVGNNWDESEKTKNNVYVLDPDLKIIGALENLAPEERIYAVRFAGERGYVVTFKEVDPLFIIDLKDPKKPYILGELKIPGYSDYLHPYDENHIIGIGMETHQDTLELENSEVRDVVLQQGVKMAIFDVTDETNPKEMHSEIIGERGTYSEALYDHKAFLFDKKKELLTLPISLSEIQDEEAPSNQYGETVFTGAYVYRINLKTGFDLKGRITHLSVEDELKMKNGEYVDYSKNVRRSLYMDDYLYTLSREKIKVNKLWSMDEIYSTAL